MTPALWAILIGCAAGGTVILLVLFDAYRIEKLPADKPEAMTE